MNRKFHLQETVLYIAMPVLLCAMHLVALFAEAVHFGAAFYVAQTSVYWLPAVLVAIITNRAYRNGYKLWLNSVLLSVSVAISCVLYYVLMYAKYFGDADANAGHIELFWSRTVLSVLVGIIFVLIYNLIVFAKERVSHLNEARRRAATWTASVGGAVVAHIPLATEISYREIDDLSVVLLMVAIIIPVVITCAFCIYMLNCKVNNVAWALVWLLILTASSGAMSAISCCGNPNNILMYSVLTLALNTIAVGITCLIYTIIKKRRTRKTS